MGGEKDLVALIDAIYEAVFDNGLWPSVLIKIADVIGAAQVAMPSADRQAKIIETIAPRVDPDLCASFKEYWAFRDPVFGQAILRPPGKVYTLDHLTRRETFAASPVFNELWRAAGWGLAFAGSNLVAEAQFSAMICISNSPGSDFLTKGQLRLFEAVSRHLGRAVYMSRQLWKLDLAILATAERFEMLPDGALLADAAGRVVLANGAAKAMLDARDGIFLRNGRLAITSSPNVLQQLVASCARNCHRIGSGGEFIVPRECPKSALRVTVAPLRSRARLPDVPWIGLGSPVAIVTVANGQHQRERRQKDLCNRFDLTLAEGALAAEILLGDGRKAAAKRCGMSDQTAKTHLGSIFGKTGTHRQAELVRFLLSSTGEQQLER
jgi:DNA-binding CsgD family transcriptional regulator